MQRTVLKLCSDEAICMEISHRWKDQLLEVFAKLWKMGFVHWFWYWLRFPSNAIAKQVSRQCGHTHRPYPMNRRPMPHFWAKGGTIIQKSRRMVGLQKSWLSHIFPLGTGLQQRASNSVQEIIIPSMNQRQTRNKKVEFGDSYSEYKLAGFPQWVFCCSLVSLPKAFQITCFLT